jgi:putative ABC transport system ATP-binding protein
MIFRVQCLSYRYKTRQREVLALDDVSLGIPAGSRTAVLGMSASGKTTLLNVLGLLAARRSMQLAFPRMLAVTQHAHGSVVFQNGEQAYDYGRLSSAVRDRIRRQQFGFVLQSSYLLPNFTCGQNIELPLVLQRVPASLRSAARERLLAELDGGPGGSQELNDLRDCMSSRPATISGGQGQRVAVLRAVLHDPLVVFADEPFASLDPKNTERIVKLLCKWQGPENRSSRHGRRTLVVVTHNIDLAYEELADHFVLLKRGALVRGRVLTKADLPSGKAEIRRLIEPDGSDP